MGVRCWERIINDFDALAPGMVVSSARGRPQTWRFILLICTAGEEVKVNEFGMPSYNAEECCVDCNANTTTMPWTDLGRKAEWRGTQEMPFDLFKGRFRKPHHPMVASHYFCDRWLSLSR